MARISYADPDRLQPHLRTWFDILPPDPRLFLAFARAEGTAGLVMDLAFALHRALKLPERLVELVATTVTRVEESEYLRQRHIPRAGLLTDAERDAILQGTDAPTFDDRDHAVLRLSEAISAGPRVGEATYAAAREHLSDRELVELIQVHAYYWMAARTATVLDIDADA
ncbi:carboxymuconolactone decarboxylase family protein [Nocardia sp. NPDC127526]|uniref:carboxymuconolactone decarboxylase family protein n=1 Tax=Nocardia sp. NPDC127526 TaxID=3345393 RepID=UPI0036438ED5